MGPIIAQEQLSKRLRIINICQDAIIIYTIYHTVLFLLNIFFNFLCKIGHSSQWPHPTPEIHDFDKLESTLFEVTFNRAKALLYG